MKTTDADVMGELRVIRAELSFIKAHMVDVDTILTPQEAVRHEEALAARRAGKAVSLDRIRR
jgi:hypothetical protein